MLQDEPHIEQDDLTVGGGCYKYVSAASIRC